MSEPCGKTIHVHLDARGAFTNFRKREWRNVVKDEEGRYLTPDEVKEWLLDQIAQGKKALPFGEPCEGFSYETGCPGHQAGPDCAQRYAARGNAVLSVWRDGFHYVPGKPPERCGDHIGSAQGLKAREKPSVETEEPNEPDPAQGSLFA